VRRLLARGTLYSSATALQLVVGLVALPVITRLLTADEYGLIAVAMVIQLTLALLAAAGIPDILPRTYFRADGGPARAASLVTLVACTAFGVALAAEFTGPWWARRLLGIGYGTPVRLAVWSSVAVAVLTAAQALLRARDRARPFLLTAMLSMAGTQAAGVGLLLVWQRTPTAYFTGIVLGNGAAAVTAVAASGFAVRPLAEPRFVRRTLLVSSPVVVSGLSFYLLWAGNRVVLNRLEGAAAAGRFQVAFLVGGLTITFLNAIYLAWSPITFGVGDERRWQTLADTARAVYTVAAAAAAAIALAAPAALVVLAPADYKPRDLTTVSVIIALAAVPFAAYLANLQVLLWHGRTGRIAVVTASVAALNVALTVALVHPFGLEGAAAATTASFVVQALLLYTIAHRLAALPSTRRALAAATALAAAGAAAAVVAPSNGPWLGLHLVAAVMLVAWVVLRAVRLE
jgi:O-antigen/teichoic acid export membrane protein